MAKRRLSVQQQRRIQRKHRPGDTLEQDGDNGNRGIVVARFGKQADICTDENLKDFQTLRCHIRANVQDVVTGDRVQWEAEDQRGIITAVLPRRSLMSRPDSQGKLRPLAANVSQIAVVIAPQPEAHQNLVDRYLVAIENLGISPLLVLNKADLVTEHGTALADLVALYRALDYPVVTVSATSGAGLDAILLALNNQATVFVGQSGVGKSSLINRVCPAAGAAVGELSQVAKGRHTTTTARLYPLPTGGCLIDSPGIREFGLWHLDAPQVASGFVEFRPHLGHCKFRNCRHVNEPGCAVIAACGEGKISAARLASYRQIIHDSTPG